MFNTCTCSIIVISLLIVDARTHNKDDADKLANKLVDKLFDGMPMVRLQSARNPARLRNVLKFFSAPSSLFPGLMQQSGLKSWFSTHRHRRTLTTPAMVTVEDGVEKQPREGLHRRRRGTGSQFAANPEVPPSQAQIQPERIQAAKVEGIVKRLRALGNDPNFTTAYNDPFSVATRGVIAATRRIGDLKETAEVADAARYLGYGLGLVAGVAVSASILFSEKDIQYRVIAQYPGIFVAIVSNTIFVLLRPLLISILANELKSAVKAVESAYKVAMEAAESHPNPRIKRTSGLYDAKVYMRSTKLLSKQETLDEFIQTKDLEGLIMKIEETYNVASRIWWGLGTAGPEAEYGYDALERMKRPEGSTLFGSVDSLLNGSAVALNRSDGLKQSIVAKAIS